jgi:predicted O-methyltransferase YrrM
MKYTQSWNQLFISNTLGIKNLDLCLEIGSFEGLTSNYICDNLLSQNGKLICVDPLTENYLNTDLTEFDIVNNETIYKYFNNQYERFFNNTKHQINLNKLELIRLISVDAFPKLIELYKGQFDLIYIDGDHRANAVYIDAINSYELCKIGGIMIFDDYTWGLDYNEQSTKTGIDKFLNEYENKYEIIIKGYQIVLKKV